MALAIVTEGTSALAATMLEATCVAPRGHVYGTFGQRVMDEADGIDGGYFRFRLAPGAKTVDITSRDRLGSTATTQGFIVADRPDSLTFIEPSGADFWLYTLYRPAGPVLMSTHTRGFGDRPGNALGKTMLATCTVSSG